MTNLFDLTGKVALLVGGAGGIGSALAMGLAEHGADIMVADLRLEPFEDVADKIHALGRQGIALTVDVTQEKSVEGMVKRALEAFPHIDILVNAAGINIRKSTEDSSVDEWQKVMDVNARGTFLCCQAVGRVMIKQGSGKIINISSLRGRYATRRGGGVYCISKGAVDTMTRTLACEWAKYNVLVNAIAPAVVETDMTRSVLADPEAAERLRASIPIGRRGIPEDFIGPVVFLASKASDFFTGQILYIDGGLTTYVGS